MRFLRGLAATVMGFCLLMACACEKVVEDKSAPAVESHDLTLISSPCENVPGRGLDICRFTEGSPVQSYWRVLVPSGSRIRGGQAIVQYKGFSKPFAVSGSEVVIPWADIIGVPNATWTEDLAGSATLLTLIEWQDDQGVWKTARARGEARVLVLPSDYATLPLDSGSQAYEARMKCRAQFTTAGRSAIKCVPDKSKE